MQLSILIVEDDFNIRTALEEILEEEGFAVQTADNGAQALQLLRDGLRPDIVLLDLMMPVMDGATFLETAREHGLLSESRVIVTSALGDACNLPMSTEVLRKPFPIDALLTRVLPT